MHELQILTDYSAKQIAVIVTACIGRLYSRLLHLKELVTVAYIEWMLIMPIQSPLLAPEFIKIQCDTRETDCKLIKMESA